MIPKNWKYFRLDHLYIRGDAYQIVYDKTGEKYVRRGWTVYQNGVMISDRVCAADTDK